MGLLEEMGISEVGELSLDELKGKIFEARKKAVLRQNAANTDKRVKAELMMETISEISTMLDSLADDSVDYALLVNTYAYAHDNGQINKDLKEALVKAAQKDIPNIERITEFYRNNGPKELASDWTNYCGLSGGKITFYVEPSQQTQQKAAPAPRPMQQESNPAPTPNLTPAQLLQMARESAQCGAMTRSMEYYKQLWEKEPSNIEAFFYSKYYKTVECEPYEIVDDMNALRESIIPAFDMICAMTSDFERRDALDMVCGGIATAVNDYRSGKGGRSDQEKADIMNACALCSCTLGNQLEARIIGMYPEYKDEMNKAWNVTVNIYREAASVFSESQKAQAQRSMDYTTSQLSKYNQSSLGDLVNAFDFLSQKIFTTRETHKLSPKLTAIIGYLTIFGFLFALKHGDRKGASVHLNNSLLIIIARWLTLYLSAKFFGSAGETIHVILTFLWLRGFVWAIQDEAKMLPVIGKIRLIR